MPDGKCQKPPHGPDSFFGETSPWRVHARASSGTTPCNGVANRGQTALRRGFAVKEEQPHATGGDRLGKRPKERIFRERRASRKAPPRIPCGWAQWRFPVAALIIASGIFNENVLEMFSLLNYIGCRPWYGKARRKVGSSRNDQSRPRGTRCRPREASEILA